MSKKSNRINVPEARESMDKFKMEAANVVGVNLKFLLSSLILPMGEVGKDRTAQLCKQQ